MAYLVQIQLHMLPCKCFREKKTRARVRSQRRGELSGEKPRATSDGSPDQLSPVIEYLKNNSKWTKVCFAGTELKSMMEKGHGEES